MRRAYFAAGLAALAAFAAFLVIPLRPSSAARTEEKAKETGKSPTAALLPVAQVVLFSSGVGYFQREGSIEGDQRIDLTFPVSDINDLIKSMTLRDLDGGHIDAVSYESNVPVERTLWSPLTWTMWRAAGGPLADSIRHYATWTNAGLIATGLAGAVLAPLLCRSIPVRPVLAGVLACAVAGPAAAAGAADGARDNPSTGPSRARDAPATGHRHRGCRDGEGARNRRR